jgi:hypothetical protein
MIAVQLDVSDAGVRDSFLRETAPSAHPHPWPGERLP